ncbi:glycosyl hydrolase family 17 protein [Maribacter sp. 2307ULW6-5]|uniref:glycosyl hydrolase family 17 protein n=1 Tax=Maribacter sp. 2307ULW6-5 TaxID=3386275 RepID=UPI0039BD1AB5
MRTPLSISVGGVLLMLSLSLSCGTQDRKGDKPLGSGSGVALKAREILGHPDYLAISYGGYRQDARDVQPTVAQIKEDMRLLSAMGIGLLRTYNVHLPHAANVLKAISELKEERPQFEMYVMLGAWIDCKNAWTDRELVRTENSERNAVEIAEAVRLANAHPDIVKVIAVGNEAMVKWASGYYVEPQIVLSWVNHLQGLKAKGQLLPDVWITSSDNFAAWGRGGAEYHVPALEELIHAVDFLSVHTYPMHDTHYNPGFWERPMPKSDLTKEEKIEVAMLRARDHAMAQYQAVYDYMRSIGANKPIHIGETGWATVSNAFYGPKGSRATDEYKQALYYRHMRSWTREAGMACFYFEAFDEPWKDAGNPFGSENHFGLFTVSGQAKYALWPLVDERLFQGLGRNGVHVAKTFNGRLDSLMATVMPPPEPKTPE